MKTTFRAALVAGVVGVAGGGAASQTLLPGSTNIYVDGRNMGWAESSPRFPIDLRTFETHGIRVLNAQPDGYKTGVWAEARSDRGRAVFGDATADRGLNFGVYGRTLSRGGRGVYGRATNAQGVNYGVLGEALGASGIGTGGISLRGTGVYGTSRDGAAVLGESTGDGYAGFFVGGASVFDGNVGIGEVNPQQPLHVLGDARIESGQMFVNATDQDVFFADQSQLFVSSGLRFPIYVQRTNTQELFYVDTDGVVFARDYAAISDERTKTAIEPVEDALEAVLSLEGVTFEWREGHPGAGKGRQIGLIAQDVEKVLPDAVIELESGYKGVRYANLVAVLIEAAKTQQMQIDAARADAEAARAENAELRAALEALVARVGALEAAGE